MTDLPLKCRCGTVTGTIRNVSPTRGNHGACCCLSCQRFANHLQPDGSLLDEFGGTEVYQMPLAYLEIDTGHEQLRCLRLTQKGPLRWYTACCRTPIGNTLTAGFPFLGLIASIVDGDLTAAAGPITTYVQTQHALKPITGHKAASAFPPGAVFKIMAMMLSWKLQGLNKPTPLFDSDGKPVATVEAVGMQ